MRNGRIGYFAYVCDKDSQLSTLVLFHLSALLLAFLLDWAFGDPPNRFHPAAWMGSFIQAAFRKRPSNQPALEFLFGAALTVTGAFLFAGFAYGLQMVFINQLSFIIGVIIQAILLKTTFSMRGLWRAAGEIQANLEISNLSEARRLLAWHLVSRDTSKLEHAEIAAATIESLAENMSDSMVAPLIFYAIGGLPLAIAYRFINTADSILGYRDKAHEWVGKFPARLDDALNFIPARITGLLIGAGAFIMRVDSQAAFRIMRRDARLTGSPNAGYPMSAMAGALSIELEKAGDYCLGGGNRLPNLEDIQTARDMLKPISFLAVVILLPVLFLRL